MIPVGYLLDTVLVSELVKRDRNPAVLAWIDAQDDAALFISVITLGEIQKGISRLPESPRKERLRLWLARDLPHRFGMRTLDVDSAVALLWGQMQGDAARRGETLPVVDCLIAATAWAHHLTVVTRNVRDMERCGVSILNPWDATGP